MFDQGSANSDLSQLWQSMPMKANEKVQMQKAFNAAQLLPKEQAYYRFNGSLTTPPCTEGVTWLVLKTALTISAEQVAQFEKAVGGHNNRPVQPINARPILK